MTDYQENNGTPENQGTEQTQSEQQQHDGQEKTFTQADVDRIIKGRLSRYSDYEALKEKAQKYDEAQEAAKSDLERATEKAAALQKELDALKQAAEISSTRAEVSKEKNVPAELLTGTTKEECEAQADALLAWSKPAGYPKVKDGGDPTKHSTKTTRDLFAEWIDSQK